MIQLKWDLLSIKMGVSTRFAPLSNFAHRVIEEAMLCANVCAARLIERSQVPGLYRVHERPESEKIDSLGDFLVGYGIDLGNGESGDYQAAIGALQGKKMAMSCKSRYFALCNKRFTRPKTAGILDWLSITILTLPRQSGVTQICSCIASSSP